MKSSFFSFLSLVTGSYALSIPFSIERDLAPRQSCENSPTSRNCWGDYSIETDYYDVIPDTGATREYWLSLEQGDCSPDGYKRTCMTFNGTIPGPTLIADWGDDMVIHVTNNMQTNGSAIHWHGLRQYKSVQYDGVPGVTQCPIAPGQSMTYKFKVTQYGSTWYHSHFSLQYAEGLFGSMVLNGPASANYDIDLGPITLGDWPHTEAFALWDEAKQGAPPEMETGLINGTNTWDCTGSTDPKCVGGGKKFEVVFEPGKTHRLRLTNVAVEGWFQFSIDGHNLTVIANDLVPIKPFTTDSIEISSGQRYDVLVEANAEAGDYWLRGGWVTACAANGNAEGITGIVRYDAQSTADPTSTSSVVASQTCIDPNAPNFVPYLAMDVANITSTSTETLASENVDYFKWTINSSSLYLDWSNPTMSLVLNGDTIFPTDYNVVGVNTTNNEGGYQWAVMIIEDQSGNGLTHPIHLHGHDFWVLDQKSSAFAGTGSFNTKNPVRRDVAELPGDGYLAIAFRLDNPGAWLVHCHIAWHASEGLSLEVVENLNEIPSLVTDIDVHNDVCSSWKAYVPAFPQDDSGV